MYMQQKQQNSLFDCFDNAAYRCTHNRYDSIDFRNMFPEYAAKTYRDLLMLPDKAKTAIVEWFYSAESIEDMPECRPW